MASAIVNADLIFALSNKDGIPIGGAYHTYGSCTAYTPPLLVGIVYDRQHTRRTSHILTSSGLLRFYDRCTCMSLARGILSRHRSDVQFSLANPLTYQVVACRLYRP